MNETDRFPLNAAIWIILGFLWAPFWLMLIPLVLRFIYLISKR